MTVFMSLAGPDTPPKPGAIDVRFWGSAQTWEEARKLQSKVDQIAPPHTRTYIAHSLVRTDFRQQAKLFGSGAKMPLLPYLALYIEDADADGANEFAAPLENRGLGLKSEDYERIAFDVYTAPPPPDADPHHSGNLNEHWHAVCEAVTELLDHSSGSPPGGQA